jgi:hypothetical protein
MLYTASKLAAARTADLKRREPTALLSGSPEPERVRRWTWQRRSRHRNDSASQPGENQPRRLERKSSHLEASSPRKG